MIYEELKKQYALLTEEEKNALLVYKSRLGLAINDLNKKEENIKEIYQLYKELVSNPKNLFMKMTVFKDISFASLEEFKNSLQVIMETIKSACKKIVLPEEMTIYRAFSIEKETKPDSLSKSDFISTSIDIRNCSKFFKKGNQYEHYVYQINLEAGSLVGICPYAIEIDNNNHLYLTEREEQKEVILDQDNFIFKEIQETDIDLKEGTLHLRVIDARRREEEKSYGL